MGLLKKDFNNEEGVGCGLTAATFLISLACLLTVCVGMNRLGKHGDNKAVQKQEIKYQPKAMDTIPVKTR